MEKRLHAKNRLHRLSTRYNTIPGCDRRTDDDNGYGVSIALRGKNDSGLVLVSKIAVIFELPQTKIIFYLLAMYVVLKIMIIELLYSALADILF